MEDWFISKDGFFTKHNIKFRPRKDTAENYNGTYDSVHSDIDILAINANASGYDRVFAVTCKSWQGGFNAKSWLEALTKDITEFEKTGYGREKWKYFRELVAPKWTEAFVDEMYKQTGTRESTYYIACTKIINNKNNETGQFEDSGVFKERFEKYGAQVKVKILIFKEIFKDTKERIDRKETHAQESTQIGRLMQLMKASGCDR